MHVWEQQFLIVARKYGDWPRILDPAFDPPSEFYAELQAAGFTREEFDRLRAECGRPERETWIRRIAAQLYWERRRRFEQTPRECFLRSMAMLEDDMRKYFEDLMVTHSITANEVEQLILEEPNLFPSLPVSGKSNT